MGTKVQCESYFPGYNPMNNRNDNSNTCNWPLLYGDKSVCGPYYNGFFPTPTAETYVGGEKDVVKLTMLEHEAVFKNQVHELHRLYRIQRDMMEEFKRKTNHERGDGFSSEKLIPSQIAFENVQKCHFTSTNGPYSSSSGQGNYREVGSYRSPNESIVKEFERPTKSKKILDLRLPADEYIDSDDDEQTHDKKTQEMSDYLPNKNQTCSILWNSNGFGDLNEPLQLQETNVSSRDDFTWETSVGGETRNIDLSSKPSRQLLDISREISLNSSYGSDNAMQNNHDLGKNRNGRGIFSNLLKPGIGKDNEKPKFPLSSKPIPGFLNAKAEEIDGPEKSLEHLTNPYNNRASEKIHEATYYFDMNSRVARSCGSSEGGTHRLAFAIEDGKAQNENHRSLLPWLKAMHSSMNEAENSSRLVNDGEISFARSSMENGDCPKNALSRVVKFGSCSDDERGSKKILGFTIFDKSQVSKTESFSVTSPSEKTERENGRKIRALDINVPCDPSVGDSETTKNHTVSSSRHQIDLNLCLSEDEHLFDINLEAPAIPELTENLVEELESLGEPVIMAAEALVSISSCKNLNKEEEEDSLLWFVDIALSKESNKKWIDHFEAMTLSLKEITEHEFMPKPPFPNDVKFEESQTRVRRGQSRRGRQRRDFQREVLPGLTTLSRHEVTEDLQAFSDLMAATGLSFSGLTRRNSGRNNGGGRGRRKAVVAPSPLQNTNVACNIEAGLDDRSLTGWGKTIRRPRRQRIPAGNLNVVQLS